jgi:hypothetical protein
MRRTRSLFCGSCSHGRAWESCTSAAARAPDGHGTSPILHPPQVVATEYQAPFAVRRWVRQQRQRKPSQWWWNVSRPVADLPSWVARKNSLLTTRLRDCRRTKVKRAHLHPTRTIGSRRTAPQRRAPGRTPQTVAQVLRSGNGHRLRVNLNGFRQPWSWPCSLGAAPSLWGDAVAVAEAADEIGGVAQAGSGGHGVE